MFWKVKDKLFNLTERPLVMGILNVTPDSFSDGGAHFPLILPLIMLYEWKIRAQI